MTQKKTILIQCATPIEFDALRVAFGGIQVERIGKRQFFRAERGGVYECVIVRGAVGKVWAAASAEFAISRFQPTFCIDFGAAGALVPELRVGDLVLADKIVEHDVWFPKGHQPTLKYDHYFEGEPENLAGKNLPFQPGSWVLKAGICPQFIELSPECRATRGGIAAGDKDVQSLEERADVAKKVGAIAATWESSAIGRVCEFHGVPYLSIRVISDVGIGDLYAEYKENSKRVLATASKIVAELFV